MRDTVTLGVVSGLIGNFVKDLSSYLIWRARKTELLYAHLAGSIFSPPESAHDTGYLVVGQLVDMAVGASIGIPLVYLLKKTGKDNYLLKGAAVGMGAWGLLYGAGPRLGLTSIRPKLYKTHLSALWNNLLYGLVTAHAAVSLADPGMFPESPARERSAGQRDGV
jgi:hypothetical protein